MLTLIPVIPLLATSFITIVVTVILGMYSLRRQMCGYLFSGSVALTFAIGAAALVISIPVYLYALPGHHCPFCMLHREYGYVGYLLYGTLLGGAVCGLAVGMLQPFRYRPSLLVALPRIQRALVLSSLILLGFFGILSAFLSMVSELRLS